MDQLALVQTIVGFRKHYDSVEDIKVKLDAAGEKVSEQTMYSILKKNKILPVCPNGANKSNESVPIG